MPLVYAPLNVPLKVVRVAADDKLKKHLESLGIAAGSEISVLSCESGSAVCKVKEGRLALDQHISTHIFVEVQQA